MKWTVRERNSHVHTTKKKKRLEEAQCLNNMPMSVSNQSYNHHSLLDLVTDTKHKESVVVQVQK